MSRKLLIRSDVIPYHVTARTNNKEPFHLELLEMWEALALECFSIHVIHQCEIHGLVLMPNHFHMLLTSPQSDLGVVMRELMSNVTRRSNSKSGRTGHLFGGPYHWTLVNSSRYFHHVLKYIYRNPVRGHLCTRAEEYPFSTLSGLIGGIHLPFPIHLTRLGMENRLPSVYPLEWLNWINTPFPSEVEKVIGAGLRKKIFIEQKNRTTRKSNLLS